MNKVIVKKIDKKVDDRGWLVEFLKKEDVTGDFGQFYVTTAHPGKIKANHYHLRKVEWFCVIRGTGELVLEDIRKGNRRSIIMSEENMFVVKIPPFIAHGIKNIGNDLMYLLVYTNEVFNPEDPDTFYKEVVQ